MFPVFFFPGEGAAPCPSTLAWGVPMGRTESCTAARLSLSLFRCSGLWGLGPAEDAPPGLCPSPDGSRALTPVGPFTCAHTVPRYAPPSPPGWHWTTRGCPGAQACPNHSSCPVLNFLHGPVLLTTPSCQPPRRCWAMLSSPLPPDPNLYSGCAAPSLKQRE